MIGFNLDQSRAVCFVATPVTALIKISEALLNIPSSLNKCAEFTPVFTEPFSETAVGRVTVDDIRHDDVLLHGGSLFALAIQGVIAFDYNCTTLERRSTNAVVAT